MNINQLFSMEGRTALVTGGSRGVGKMIAAGFVAAGAKVYISSRKTNACVETAIELGPMCEPLPADISTISGCELLARELSTRELQLDVLVNNAGATWGADFESFPETGWDKVMDLNVKSSFFLTQKLYPLLKRSVEEERPAKVINIGSVDGQRLSSWETYSYHASKAAILFLTKRLAARLVTDGINVTAITPGAFASDMNLGARDHAEDVARHIPAGRVGNAEDIAAAAIYLASRAGDYVVGDSISVDGGLVHAAIGTALS